MGAVQQAFLARGVSASLGPPTDLILTNSYASRNGNFWVGCDFTVGASNLTVTRLGRWVFGTETANRTSKVFRFDSSGAYAEVCTGVVALVGPGGGYLWGTASACILLAGIKYLIASDENLNSTDGAPWADLTGITATADVTLGTAQYVVGGGGSNPAFADWNAGAAGSSYGGPNLTYQK